MSLKMIEGSLQINGGRYAIVVSRWNSFVVENLLNGAVNSLTRHGVTEENINIVMCPGAFEIPLIVKKVAKTQRFDAIIALGAVIRGKTPHFECLTKACIQGLSRVNLEEEIPVSCGILIVDTIEQAIERSGTKAGNKGEEAAVAAFEMVSLFKKLEA